MSLTSRLFSLITSDSSSDAQSQVASKHNGFADSLLQPGSIRQNTGLRAMEATIEEDLEAKRPPYWQVSTPTVYTILRPNVCTEHCLQVALAAPAAISLCTRSTQSKQDSKAILTFHPSTRACPIRTLQFSGKKASAEGCMEVSERLCWGLSQGQ